MAVLLAGLVSAQPADALHAEAQHQLDLLNAALTAQDREKVEQFFAPEFVFVHSVGGVEERRHYIDGLLQNHSALPVKVDPKSEIRVYGDVVIIRNVKRPNVAGAEINFSTQIVRRQGGIWRQVQVQGTRLPR